MGEDVLRLRFNDILLRYRRSLGMCWVYALVLIVIFTFIGFIFGAG
jgi:hypothetical protein